VAEILKELNWTLQQPIEKAIQRNEQEIGCWRKEVWLEIKRKAHLEHRIPVFIDESGFYLLPATLRTYPPRGQTLVLRVFQTRDHLSVMSGITQDSWLFTLTRSEALTGSDSVYFLKHLLSQTLANCSSSGMARLFIAASMSEHS
jgi:hypothetical protein